MSISLFFESKGQAHAEVLQKVHLLLTDAHPAMQSTIKWGLPCYFIKKNIAYLDVQKGKPLIGFNYGSALIEVHELLDFTGRKQIGHFSLENLNEDRLGELLTIIDVAIDFDLKRR